MRRLRAQQSSPQKNSNASTISSVSTFTQPSPPSPQQQQQQQKQLQNVHRTNNSQSRLSALASLLHYRRLVASSAPEPSGPGHNSQQGSVASIDSNASELQNVLSHEKTMRKAAESQLTQVNMELEELTVQLFTEANEMVAQERRARAKLEDRVTLLEQRDLEKRKRLERLERAIARVERVRKLVG